MKRLLLLITVFITINAFAQRKDTVQRILIHHPFAVFFQKYPQFREIHIRDWAGRHEVNLIEQLPSEAPYRFHFNREDPGDVYYFNKWFGRDLSIPEHLLNLTTPADAYATDLRATIRKDSFILTAIHYLRDPSDTDQRYFTRIERRDGYTKGLHLLADTLAMKTNGIEVTPPDSTLLLRILVEKDGTVVPHKRNNGDTTSRYVQAVMQFLSQIKGWIPYETGGRKVRSYRELYIRKQPDGSIDMAMN